MLKQNVGNKCFFYEFCVGNLCRFSEDIRHILSDSKSALQNIITTVLFVAAQRNLNANLNNLKIILNHWFLIRVQI